MTMAVCAHLDQIKLTEPRDGPIQVGCQAEAFVGATQGIDMRLISMQELKEKLDRGDPLKLVNALGEWEYRAKHIPGSLHFPTPEETLRGLGRDDEIVVHCSNPLLYGQRRAVSAPGAERLPEHSTLRWRPAGVGGGRVSAGRGDGGFSGRRTQDRPRLR
jgi:hypothetical protein